MPFLDRFWWLRIAGGVAFILATLALASAYSASARTSRSAVASPWPGVIVTLLLPLLAIVVALWWSFEAWRAVRRAIARSRALVGDVNAMPVAAFSGDPS